MSRSPGDLSGAFPLRSAGGMFNALALLLFIIGMIGAVVRGKLTSTTTT